MSDSTKRKVYSPDIVLYSFDGKGWVLGTITSILIAPFRLVSRVMHNIFVMPADIQDKYAEGLFVVAGLVSLLGFIDFIFFHKWVLLVSQLPLFPLAYKIRKSALKAKSISKKKRVVDVDYDELEKLAEAVYDDLNKIIKE